MKSYFFGILALSASVLAGCAGSQRGNSLLLESPAPYGVYSEGLIGRIEPQGWLREFLERQRTGLTGHPEAMCYPFNSCLWAGSITRETEEHGDNWWRYEQTAYYTDGLLRLGYLLDDEDLIKIGEDGVHYTLDNLSEDGSYGFREMVKQGEKINVSEMISNGQWLLLWPQAVFFRVIQAYYEATGDESIPSILERHFLNFKGYNYGSTRNIVNVEGLLWTYAHTGNPELLALAEEGWKDGHFELSEEVCYQEEPLYIHGVSCCEEMKVPMLLYAYTGNEHYLDVARHIESRVEQEAMLPDGVPSSAEHLSGRIANHSHETCDISDFSWTMGYYLMVTGEAKWGDKLEKAVFNAGPGAVGKDFKTLQYFSSVNQFIATGTSNNNEFMHGKSWMEYRPTHETECCAGNVHRFMPNYVSRMWLQSGPDSIVAALYGPSKVRVPLSDGRECTIVEDTEYPFDGDDVNFKFSFGKGRSSQLSFSFRIPETAASFEVKLNGKDVDYELLSTGFAVVDGKFRSGDVLSVSFDFPIEIKSLEGQGEYVQRGQVLYAYSIPTETVQDTTTYAHLNGKVSANPDFKCWSKTPSGAWNYALSGAEAANLSLERISSCAYPLDEPSSKISVPVVEIADWTLDEGIYTPDIPEKVVPISGVKHIDLVPYASTYLRLTVFPAAE